MLFLRSLYNRMSFVHYVGMVLLILNVAIFTDNLFSQIIQLIIVAALVVHEWDEYANGRKLSKALSDYLKNMDNPNHYALDINTSIASEYDKIKSIINKREDIQKLKDVEDNLLIEDARKVISDIINGIYGNTIELSTSNEVLNNFKDEVNEMIIATRDNIGSINRVLQEYSNHNYTNTMKVPNIDKKSDIGLLVENVNNVQQSIVKILTDNNNNGTILRDNSSALRKSVQRLHSNSDESEASLKKTASSLKDITNSVRSDTKNIVSMATLSSQVTDSGIIGQELATQTMSSMNEINEQVEAISEAVLIIDKISFQTKILSLNASVEAANTGEAGKGFAVVAQEVRALATKSSEASNEIKILVENATIKAKDGKKVSENMIKGYASLNNNISKTMKLISKIEASAKEQMLGIEQINQSIDTLSEQTKENANVAHQTHDIANQTDKVANIIVENMNTKKFISNLN